MTVILTVTHCAACGHPLDHPDGHFHTVTGFCHVKGPAPTDECKCTKARAG